MDVQRVCRPPVHTERYGLPMLLLLGLFFATTAIHVNPVESSLPGLAVDLGAPANSTASVVAVFFFGMMLGHLVIGPVSDILGRRRTIAAGLVALLLGALLCAAASSLPVLILGRAVQGVGGAAVLCAGRAVGGDAGHGRRSTRTLSVMEIIAASAAIVTPLLGNCVAEVWGWRAVFLAMACVDVLLLLGLAVFVRETATVPSHDRWHSWAADLRTGLVQSRFVLLVLAFGSGVATFFTCTGASAFVYINMFGLTKGEYALYFSVLGVTMVGGGVIAAVCSKRFRPEHIFQVAVVVQWVATLCMGALFATGSATAMSVSVCFAIIAGGHGLVLPVGLSLAMGAAGRVTGSAAALCGFVQYGISWICTSLLSLVVDAYAIGVVASVTMTVTTVFAFACCRFSLSRTDAVRDIQPDNAPVHPFVAGVATEHQGE